MNPQYPIYIVSKGRWQSRLTVKALERARVPYRIVVEPQEYDAYAAVIDPANILTLPFGSLGQGSIPARNWIWEHAVGEGHRRHWVLDDNIREFYYLYKNIKYRITSGTIFRAAEDFVDRYANVPLAGFQYEKFAPRRAKRPPFALNTRVYSCILIDSALDLRWRGRYNEDTDLSLRVLKRGLCTVLFYIFLAEKVTTMKMRGGNTDTLYRAPDARLKMAQSLVLQHPDVARVTWKWNRWQHQIDYSKFKNNRLILRPDAVIPPESPYRMRFVHGEAAAAGELT